MEFTKNIKFNIEMILEVEEIKPKKKNNNLSIDLQVKELDKEFVLICKDFCKKLNKLGCVGKIYIEGLDEK